MLVTTDRRIRNQQNLRARGIALVVLTGSTKWSLVRQHGDRIAAAVASATPGSYIEVEIPFESDVGPDYLVMEYVEGTTLKGPVPVADALRLASQIAEALAAAHRKGIVHRDLKPANILVNESGAKLLDFGLAQIDMPLLSGDATISVALSERGAIVGTVAYLSPEQARGRPWTHARTCSPSARCSTRY